MIDVIEHSCATNTPHDEAIIWQSSWAEAQQIEAARFAPHWSEANQTEADTMAAYLDELIATNPPADHSTHMAVRSS